MYKLTKEFAQSNAKSEESIKYIRDSEFNPFEEDIIYITDVYNEVGEKVPLNVQSRDDSVYTPQYNVVQIPEANGENSIAVVYRADHKPFDLRVQFPQDVEIDIPSTLIIPLTLYVSYLANAAIGTPETTALSQAKQAEYELACLDLEMRGTIRQDDYEFNIGDAGWV